MTETPDTTPIISGPDDADACVVLLHGLGADAADLAGLAEHLGGDRRRFVFPNAPVRAVTINAGMRMRAWYDIDPAQGPDAGSADIEESATSLEALLDEVAGDIAPERLVIGGFSQGGVIALHQSLRHGRRLAGTVALSTYLHDPDRLAGEVALANAELPIFMAHGQFDPMIPMARAAASRDVLEGLGYAVSWHQYPMGHEVSFDEIRDLARWLDARLGA